MAWHTIKDAAPLIGLSVSNVYRLIESRRLAHRRVGLRKGSGRIEISDEAIAAFLKSCEVAAIEPASPGSASPGSASPGSASASAGRGSRRGKGRAAPLVGMDGGPLEFFPEPSRPAPAG